jgi:hypothetical protein
VGNQLEQPMTNPDHPKKGYRQRSFTLSPGELQLIDRLAPKYGSKLAVVRRGLELVRLEDQGRVVLDVE